MNDTLLKNDYATVTKSPLNNEFDAIIISHQYCEAKVSLYGGHVLSFKPTGEQDVFWVSDKAAYQQGKAIRGGIPLCWPWFGVHDKKTAENPIVNHGFARQSLWQLEHVFADEKETTVVLSFAGENTHPMWPYAFKVVQTLVFGQAFKQTLSMTNLSSQDAHYSGALHSYLRVSNPSEVSLERLTGVEYEDKLTNENTRQQSSVSCVGPIDREYHSADMMQMVDKQWQRTLTLSTEGCQQWVLWNPGTELANTMADIHHNGEQEFVCLEAANTHWQPILAGETVSISQTIRVK